MNQGQSIAACVDSQSTTVAPRSTLKSPGDDWSNAIHLALVDRLVQVPRGGATAAARLEMTWGRMGEAERSVFIQHVLDILDSH